MNDKEKYSAEEEEEEVYCAVINDRAGAGRVTEQIENEWGRDPIFFATAKMFVREILEARSAENTNESVWEIKCFKCDDSSNVNDSKSDKRMIRKCEICGIIVEFTQRKDSKIYMTVDDGTGLIECVIWAPATNNNNNQRTLTGNDYDYNNDNQQALLMERDAFGRIVADDGVMLLHGQLKLGETCFVQGRIGTYMGKKQITANSVQIINAKEGLARERDLESLFWLDCIDQRNDRGYSI